MKLKTSQHHTSHKEKVVDLIVIGVFFAVTSITSFIGFCYDWWQEFRPEKEGDNY